MKFFDVGIGARIEKLLSYVSNATSVFKVQTVWLVLVVCLVGSAARARKIIHSDTRRVREILAPAVKRVRRVAMELRSSYVVLCALEVGQLALLCTLRHNMEDRFAHKVMGVGIGTSFQQDLYSLNNAWPDRVVQYCPAVAISGV